MWRRRLAPDPQTSSPPLSPSPSRRKILIVEDDLGSARALRLLLQHSGFDVALATTVAEGLAALREEPDFIVLDLMLPDGDGAQILRYLRDRRLLIPVCVTTGVSDRARLAEVARLNPRLLLHKPIDMDKLLGSLGAAE